MSVHIEVILDLKKEQKIFFLKQEKTHFILHCVLHHQD